jgi:TolA-binding protein
MRLIHPCLLYSSDKLSPPSKEIEFAELMYNINRLIYDSSAADHVDTSAADHVDTSAADHVDTSAADHVDTSAADHVDTSAADHVDISATGQSVKMTTDQIGTNGVHRYYSHKFKPFKHNCFDPDCAKFVEEIINNITKINLPNNDIDQFLYNISQNADIYLRHFNLELIDFCISKKQLMLIKSYENVYKHINSNDFKKAKEVLKELLGKYPIQIEENINLSPGTEMG